MKGNMTIRETHESANELHKHEADRETHNTCVQSGVLYTRLHIMYL